MKKLNLSGMRFGRLTVVEPSVKIGKRTTWSCLCECGNYVIVKTEHLRSGSTKSCGCYKIDAHIKHKHTTHTSLSPTYTSWSGMISRCTNPKETGYENYGGRGIKVCERWKSSFENFLSDMGERPSREYTIDRIDVNGNYEPGNCRWATRSEQAFNTRMRKDNSSGHRGVYYDNRRKSWYARFSTIHLGTYNSLHDAIEARKMAEVRYLRKENVESTDW